MHVAPPAPRRPVAPSPRRPVARRARARVCVCTPRRCDARPPRPRSRPDRPDRAIDRGDRSIAPVRPRADAAIEKGIRARPAFFFIKKFARIYVHINVEPSGNLDFSQIQSEKTNIEESFKKYTKKYVINSRQTEGACATDRARRFDRGTYR